MKIRGIIILLATMASCTPRFNPEITSEEIRENIEFLASDSLKGRKPGQPGDALAAEFIRAKFEAAKLELLFEDGFQSFNLVTDAELGEGNSLKIGSNEYTIKDDFLPYSFSSNSTVDAPVIFAGYGLEVDRDTLKWNDYNGVNVEGKWLMALQGDPDLDNPNSAYLEFSSERSKGLIASDKQAAGLILVAGTKYNEKDELSSLFFDKNSSRFAIPVIQVTRKVANSILEKSGQTIESLEAGMLERNEGTNLETQVSLSVSVAVELKETSTQNVVAVIPGNDPELKHEYVVIGAHYDHLGMGGPGSGSRAVDTMDVHNGADDNASGVSAVIQLAEKISSEKSNKRSIIVAAFGAEEMGLLGSKEFAAKAPVATENIVAMFNFDMIGRLDEDAKVLSIGGTKTSKETEQILNDLNPGFSLNFSGEGVGPSDHASFYLQNIPVFFISTGAHGDYHTPDDDVEFINFEGAQKVMEYSYALLSEVSNREERLTFQEAGAKFQRSRGGRFKVTLGVMPDFAGVEKRGMRIDGVTKGKPASKGGMKKGDIITAIDGNKVGNIYEYMSRLKTLDAGQTITVDVLRDDKPLVLIIQL